MAPFSICSKCKVRTRKVVKDPITLKDIYLCPKCCKEKNETPAKENELGKKGRRELQEQPPAKEPEEPTETTDEPKPKPPAAAKQPLPSRKNTPPVMQTVVINGRKYIAISATASGN